MREASWNDCLESCTSIKITPNIGKAKSLIETAGERILNCSKDLTERNANFVLEDYYSSILELVHAIVTLDGYNVNNHVCLGFYIRDILKREDLFRLFDDLRYKRNSLTYYGKRLDFVPAKDSIEKAKILIKELKMLIKI